MMPKADHADPQEASQSPLAALDLGSNSFHLIVAREAGGQLQIIDRHRERVALGAGLDADLVLDEPSQERALASLARFAQRIGDIPRARLRIVATNTLRIAKNASEFIAKAEEILGASIDVISGQEEARLTWQGVNSDLPVIDGRRLLVDIGGGSTECVIGTREGILSSNSLQLGCVSMSAAIFADGVLNANRFKVARRLAQAELRSIAPEYSKLGFVEAYGSSGTINAIAKYLNPKGGDRVISASALRALERELIALGSCDALVANGIREDRARVIPGGLAVLRGVFQALKIEKMQASDAALREGVINDLVGRIHHRDIRFRSMRALMWRFHVDVSQAKRVEDAIFGLLDGLDEKHQPSQDERRFLKWAAMTHEVGLSLAFSGYHKHSAYLVKSSELDGFSEADQRKLSYLLLCHRRKLRRANECKLFSISSAEVTKLLPLTLILRLAVLLVRSRSAFEGEGVDGVELLGLSESALKIRVSQAWRNANPLSLLDLKAEQARLADANIDFTIEKSD